MRVFKAYGFSSKSELPVFHARGGFGIAGGQHDGQVWPTP